MFLQPNSIVTEGLRGLRPGPWPSEVRAPNVILASASPYRRELLARLQIEFDCMAPEIDESARPGEAPPELVRRLARLKCDAVAGDHPQALVIGSDQIAVRRGEIVAKPGDHAAAVHQLTAASGQQLSFLTAVCVRRLSHEILETHVDTTQVHFRELSTATIEAYLRRERPYDCAGSFKAESLGIVLFDAIESRDPTALVGLPLIWLAATLSRCGVPLLRD